MPRIEPTLVPVVTDLARGLRELGIPFGIVGALVPELLLAARPRRMTSDADAIVIVRSLADFEGLKDRLAHYGFTRTRVAFRLRHRDGGFADILPFSDAIAPGGRLQLEEGFVLNMAGFGHVVPSAVSIAIDGGPTLPLAPLPLYVLLTLVAFSDRKEPKDLAGILHCLEHYLEDDERRYSAEFGGQGVPFEYTSAYLLGVDAQSFLDDALGKTVTAVLDRFDDPDAEVVGIVARETGPRFVDDGHRAEIFERFRWFRVGTGPGGG
jgi:predicted nucleotidyltransferase